MNPADAFRRELHEVVDAAAGETPDLLPAIERRLQVHRRPQALVAFAQIAISGLLAVGIAAVVLSMHRTHLPAPPSAASTSSAAPAQPGARVAWIASQTTAGNVFTGVDPAGQVVGRITAPIDMRSPDGAHLYALKPNGIDVFSAGDGHLETAIGLPYTPEVEMVSADGHYAAVESAIPREVGLVDLVSRRFVASTPVAAAGVPLIVGGHAEHIFLVSNTITELSFDGSSLRTGRSVANPLGCAGQGLLFGDLNSFGGLTFRVLSDGRTLVAFCPADGRVTWFDLLALRKVGDVVNGQQNPFWVSPLFSPAGTTLYLHEGGSGRLAAIDLLARRSARAGTIAMAPGPLAWLEGLLVTPAFAGGVPRTAALSPDGRWLYAVGSFEAPGGISVVHLPELQVKARWLPNVSLDSIWASADGTTIYALSQSSSTVRLLRADGTLYATVTLPAMTDGFVVPTIP